jgi:nitrite reductase/ring-hydroxylating ferredoxin subunit
MPDQNYTWHRIAGSIDEIPFSQNGLTEIVVSGKPVCLSLHNDQLHACTQKCPHAGTPLSEGWLDAAGNIVCPNHHYKFSMQNGRNVSGEGYFLKIFPVELREDGVFVGFPATSLFDGPK